MRVSNQQTGQSLGRLVSGGWERLMAIQEKVASGVRVQRPSDDPVASGTIGLLDERLQKLEACDGSGRMAQSLLSAQEGGLSEVGEILIRIRELAVQGASEENSAANRIDIAREVRALRAQVLTIANSEVAGRYVFGGFQTDAPPFASDGTYSGDSGVVTLELSPGQNVEVNLPGDRVFLGAGGGVNLFTVLDDLANGLEADDTAAIQASLTGIDAGGTQIVASRVKAGAELDTARFADNLNQRLREGILASRSSERDTDISRAAIELAQAQQALEAAYATVPRIASMSLLNRL